MSRPQTIDTEEILRIARELFLERGPQVPTSEIARQAGISEGSIFKRFPTKRGLFLAAMGLHDHPSWYEDLDVLAGQGTLKENLITICVHITEFVRELLPRIMLVWSCREGAPEHLRALHGPQSPPRKALEALTRYLLREMQLGRMKTVNPEIAARVFLGSIWNLVFLETITQVSPTDALAHARELVDVLWKGLGPLGGEVP